MKNLRNLLNLFNDFCLYYVVYLIWEIKYEDSFYNIKLEFNFEIEYGSFIYK